MEDAGLHAVQAAVSDGVATALAAGMAALVTATCIALTGGETLNATLLLPVIAAYITIALATGWLSERLHAGRAQAELLALTDELTGLANRRHARIYLEQQVMRARRGAPVSLVMFDLDRFKAYNDKHGHPSGDIMLRTFAQVLKAAAGREAMPVRYGGEEFLVVLSACGQADAVAYAEAVRRELRKAQKTTEPVTVSAGISTFGGSFVTANDLIIAADRALYQAKEEGRDRACIAEPAVAVRHNA